MIEAALLVVFPVLAAFAASSDLLTMTIPNRVSLLLAGAFCILAAATGMPVSVFGLHLAAGALVLSACFAMFAMGWMGGGDAKFAAAAALWFGLGQSLTEFVLLTAIYGMVLTLGLLQLRLMPFVPEMLGRHAWSARLLDQKSGIPYGIALAAAALHVYPSSHWFTLLGSWH
ncbi:MULTISPECIES: prepilin peptidase [unclassified Pannonibacter]|uniref:A24 family peptidase n=1 Tax=unclassified Pannonibacter TaxID=2627228 RepID=UPI0016478000|nr:MULTISPECIES: prepilin peptidase [unclassified Pannonibacter]